MAKEKKETQIQEFESVHNALSKSEAFVEKNKTILLGGLIAVIVVVGVVLLYRNHVLIPKEQEAHEAIFKAEQYFVKDSFQLALDGDGNNLGFLAIIEEYGMTDAGNLAQAYAGVCYKMLGEYETAISYLNKFSANDMSLSPALEGAIGDCYLEAGEKENFEQLIPEGFVVESDDSDLSLYEPEVDYEEESIEMIHPADEHVLEPVPAEEAFSVRSDAVVEESKTVLKESETPLENSTGPISENIDIPQNLKQELKTVLSYMDKLLESLPEDKIEEFARSEYFDTYKKLFEELGLV